MADPAIERLRELFLYDPESGKLTWRERDRKLSGVEAGGIDPGHGYRRVHFDGGLHLAHRIAIAMTSGAWPSDQVDHLNGVRDDNRFCNLEVVSRAENLKNKARYKNNKSGVVGVHWHKQHQKWCAEISVDGKKRFIGLFEDLSRAIMARRAAEGEFGFHENHGRIQK